MAFLFLLSFRYVMYSVAVAREMKFMLYSACESSAEWAGAIKRIRLEIRAVHVYPTCARLVRLVRSIYSTHLVSQIPSSVDATSANFACNLLSFPSFEHGPDVPRLKRDGSPGCEQRIQPCSFHVLGLAALRHVNPRWNLSYTTQNRFSNAVSHRRFCNQ